MAEAEHRTGQFTRSHQSGSADSWPRSQLSQGCDTARRRSTRKAATLFRALKSMICDGGSCTSHWTVRTNSGSRGNGQHKRKNPVHQGTGGANEEGGWPPCGLRAHHLIKQPRLRRSRQNLNPAEPAERGRSQPLLAQAHCFPRQLHQPSQEKS